MRRIKFLNCYVDSLTIPDALDWMAECIRTNQPHTITVLNANKLWLMSKNERLANFVRNSDLVIPEWAIVWGAAFLGMPLVAHVGGITLMRASLSWAEHHGYRPFFLGAKPKVIPILASKLAQDYPGLQVAGYHHGYINGQVEQYHVRELIQNSRPDLIFVAMGSPKQEFWIEENLPVLGVPVAMGVGGSFDVIAGLKKDTPDWARGRGLEWLYRLEQEPGAYWRRYLITNPWFVWQIFKSRMRK